MATGAPEGCEVPCLIPGLDMFNHRTGEKVTLEADAEHAQIVCDAPVAAGTEIFINYGHKSNEELLFAYGFCLRDNPLDLVTIQLACDGAGEVGAYRRQLLRACGVPWKEAGVAPPEETDGNPAKGGGGGGAPGGEGWLSVGPFFIRSQEMGGVPGELLSALAVCMVEAPGEELQLTLDEVEGLKKKLESKLDALKPRSAADSKLVGRCGGGGAREGGSEDRAGAVAVQRRRAAAIYRDGQRRVLQEAIQELEGLLDEEDGTGP